MEAQRGAAEKKDRTVKTQPAPEVHLHLLDAELSEDVVSSYRRREAAWISLVTHGIIIALLLLVPKWSRNQPVIVPLKQSQETLFISLPDDKQQVKAPPKTETISDKDRLAQSKTPSVDKDTLRKLLDARKPGPPKAAEPPPAGQQAMQQNPATAQGSPQPEVQQTPPQKTTAQLEAPQAPGGKGTEHAGPNRRAGEGQGLARRPAAGRNQERTVRSGRDGRPGSADQLPVRSDL